MRIIPVIDLKGGRAVRGRSGRRSDYVGVQSRLRGGLAEDLSDPEALLAVFRDSLTPADVYVADLDRIAGGGDHDALVARLMAKAPEARFLIDRGDDGSGPPSPADPRRLEVLGTETLAGWEALRAAAASRPVVLSLDLGESGVVARSPSIASQPEETILARTEALGARAAIILLLGAVGTSRGLPRARLERLRRAAPRLELLAGGGIASLGDLEFLRDAGFAAALLATALHDGLIVASDLRRAGFL
jgi:phosphoribosylformimino-5-aminoimidazole carboxamide ribotide isomerase